jgi:serine/threonine protein kinase/Flp pilus assembly protein TadD
MKCPKCETDNPETSRFCAECGTQLSGSGSTRDEIRPPSDIPAGPTATLETPVEELSTGSMFAGRYQIIEELGRGGMGKVYRALDKKLNEEVALKLIKPEIASDKKTLERFSNELKIARKISHRNIGRVYEMMEDKGTHFITMEYVSGEDLRSFIRRSGRIDIPKALLVGRQVCDGLAEAHKQGVVHRDLKPSNIMIDKQGDARIMDFGIARLLTAKGITGAGIMIGTPEYMSPEQVESKEVDQRSDIYSLGIILYEMATGQVPFEGDTPFSVGMKQKGEAPPDPKQINAQIPDDLNILILKCLAKEKEQRYQSAGEVRTELERIEKGLPTTEKTVVKKKPATSREITVKFSLKRPLRWGLIVAAVVIAGLLIWRLLPKKTPLLAPKIDNSIAVISFENQTGDKGYDYLQKAIPNLLITNLERTGELYVATWERMHDLLKQMGQKDVEDIDRDLGFELCRREGIESIVTGSFVKAGDTFVTDVKVLDVATKKLLKGANVRGRGEDSILQTQIDELTLEISQGLGIAREKLEADQHRIADVTTSSMEAYSYFLQGKEYFNLMKSEDARIAMEKAVAIDPEFAAAYDWLGMIYNFLGNREARIGAVKKAMELSDRATEKERLYIQISYAYAIEGDSEKGFLLYKELAQKFPREKDVHFDLAFQFQARGMYEEAIAEFKKSLELDPGMGHALNGLTYAYSDMGDNEKAVEYAQKYVAMYPDDANPVDTLAEQYLRMGRLDEALENYKKAMEMQPDLGSAFRIAYIYALKEDYPQALKWIDSFIDHAPSAGIQAEGYYFRAIYDFMLGKKEQAFLDLGKGAESADKVGNEPRKADMNFVRGCIYYDLGNFDTAKEYLQKMFGENFSYDQATQQDKLFYNFYLGLADVRLGRMEPAKSKLEELKSLIFRSNPFLTYVSTVWSDGLQAEIWIAEGMADKTIELLERPKHGPPPSLEVDVLGPYNIPMIRDTLARAYLGKGDIDGAIAVYERKASFDQQIKELRLIHPKYYYLLGKLYEEKGEKAKAVEQYERFLELWKDADHGIPELEDAKERLSALKGR